MSYRFTQRKFHLVMKRLVIFKGVIEICTAEDTFSIRRFASFKDVRGGGYIICMRRLTIVKEALTICTVEDTFYMRRLATFKIAFKMCTAGVALV